jgi:hypothetical protein
MLCDFLKDKKPTTRFLTPFSSKEVESLFQTSIWGHREIILTVIMARLIDSNFKASEDFYACNPRSIFEKPIKKALRKYGIPHRKSGPLNVAKNSSKINRDWATDKHGGSIAMNVVKIVKKIEMVSEKTLKTFASAYIARYKQEAGRIKKMRVNIPTQENPIYISKLCVDLINFAPDGGATAQIIVGLLIELMNKDRKNSVVVSGHRDSVSTTNTTSKKPGDVIEKVNNVYELIYEITTKKFSNERLIESYEAAMSYNQAVRDIFVICRPQDIPEGLSNITTSCVIAIKKYNGLTYYFINIYDYIKLVLIFLTPNGRASFYKELIIYVNNINTAEKVKKYFKQWHLDSKNPL